MTFNKCSLCLSNNIGIFTSELNALKQIKCLSKNTNHGLVIKRKSLHGSKSVGSGSYVFKNDMSLSSHFQSFESHYSYNVTKLSEDGMKSSLQFFNLSLKKYRRLTFFLHFFVQIIHVNGMVRLDVGHSKSTTNLKEK